MHTLELKIDDNSLENVLQVLHSLKQGMIKEINIHKKTPDTNDALHLKEFHQLIRRGNNSEKLTLDNASNIDGAIDGIF